MSRQTQSSIAVSTNGRDYVLFNASPDLRQQIANTPPLQAQSESKVRWSPIAAVVLTNADVDHIAGLLSLRESQPLSVCATRRVLSTLSSNQIFDVLNPLHVRRQPMILGRTELLDPARCRGESQPADDGQLEVELFPVPGKVALYLENEEAGPSFGTVEEDTVAAQITDPSTSARFFYIPGCAAMTPELAARLKGAQLVMFDGTVFQDDEMRQREVGEKTGRRMGHMSMAGDRGSIEAFAELDVAHKVFIHVNNTNPVWFEDSPERAEIEAAGWELAHDGMTLRL